MAIKRTEASKAGFYIAPGGLNAVMRRRRELIKLTVEAWYRLDPGLAKWIAHHLKELIKVERKGGGEWRNGEGMCRMRMPSDLWHSLRKVFETHGADLEPFGQDSADIQILMEEFPKLFGREARAGRGRTRR